MMTSISVTGYTCRVCTVECVYLYRSPIGLVYNYESYFFNNLIFITYIYKGANYLTRNSGLVNYKW